MVSRKAYPSDLTDAEWEIQEPLIPAIAVDATNVVHERREIVNGILYVLRSGCPWRLIQICSDLMMLVGCGVAGSVSRGFWK